MRTREDPSTGVTYRSYLKFNVQGSNGNVQSVKLRLYVTDASNNLQGVYAIADTTWTETGIRYTGAPVIGASPIATYNATLTPIYVEITLPPGSITADGLYTFALKSVSTDSLAVNTREATTNKPQLVINGGAPPPPAVPVSAFTSNVSGGTAPVTVNFTDQSTQSPNAWAWNFGDPGSGAQNTSALQNPSHTFASPGNYTVTLTASNAAGPGSPVTHSIVVTAPGGPGDPVLVGAGDIADCGRTQDEATATLLDGIAGTVFAAGDLSYPDATTAEFANCYGPTWGRHKARTIPVVGNHDYTTASGAPYFTYWGAQAGDPTKGYYSLDIGTWHVIVLNSNCNEVGGCKVGNPQEVWLRSDLAAHPATCTVAIWHHARFTTRRTTPDGSVTALWQALYEYGADVVVSGHHHNYEKFAPQTTAGVLDNAFGIRQFVAGTGGASLHTFTGYTPMANSEVRIATHGVFKMTLHPSGYDYSFIPIAGQTGTDSGSASCHGAPPAGAAAASGAAAALQDATFVSQSRVAASLAEPTPLCEIPVAPARIAAPRFTLSRAAWVGR
jgi:PKD repeat protein